MVAQVPYILGTNTTRPSCTTRRSERADDRGAYRAELDKRYGDFAERVLAMYPVSKFGGDYRKAITRVATDSGLVCGTLDTARRAVQAGLSVYMYNFNIPWSIAPDLLGISHASEISHVFGSPYNETKQTALRAAMNELGTFAKPAIRLRGAAAVWPRFSRTRATKTALRSMQTSGPELFRKEECMLGVNTPRRVKASGAGSLVSVGSPHAVDRHQTSLASRW